MADEATTTAVLEGDKPEAGAGAQPASTAAANTPDATQQNADSQSELVAKIGALEAKIEELTKHRSGQERVIRELKAQAKGYEATLSELQADFGDLSDIALHNENDVTEPKTPRQEFESRRLARKAKQPAEPQWTPAQQVAAKELQSIAKTHGIDFSDIPEDLKSVMANVTELFDAGLVERSISVWEKALTSRPAKKKPITGTGVDRVAGTGSTNRVFTRAEITAMSDADYSKNREAIEVAQREGRIK